MRGLTRVEHQVLRYLETSGPLTLLDPELEDVYDTLEDRGLLETRYAFTEVRPVDDDYEDVIDVFGLHVTDNGRLALRVCTVEG